MCVLQLKVLEISPPAAMVADADQTDAEARSQTVRAGDCCPPHATQIGLETCAAASVQYITSHRHSVVQKIRLWLCEVMYCIIDEVQVSNPVSMAEKPNGNSGT